MIRFFLKERIAEKEFREKRKIKLDEISKESGVSRNTLSRILNTYGYSTSTEVLDKLCEYFECQLADLAEYVED
ncbi:helix-turn-helix domain-containing protein [Sneathiella limimaris]|uniref:helix-turn-helix domain-containing protein n=1 Tax=Sneathiella limimaris TaxID=1964213 RepID=UPI00146E3A0B